MIHGDRRAPTLFVRHPHTIIHVLPPASPLSLLLQGASALGVGSRWNFRGAGSEPQGALSV